MRAGQRNRQNQGCSERRAIKFKFEFELWNRAILCTQEMNTNAGACVFGGKYKKWIHSDLENRAGATRHNTLPARDTWSNTGRDEQDEGNMYLYSL